MAIYLFWAVCGILLGAVCGIVCSGLWHSRLYSKKRGKYIVYRGALCVLPVSGDTPYMEWLLRDTIRKVNENSTLGNLIVVDLGLRGEAEKICRRFCENGQIAIFTPQQLCTYLETEV